MVHKGQEKWRVCAIDRRIRLYRGKGAHSQDSALGGSKSRTSGVSSDSQSMAFDASPARPRAKRVISRTEVADKRWKQGFEYIMCY